MDIVKATAEDYAPLYEQLDIIKEDFDKIYDMENVEMNLKNNVVVKFKSKECNLKAEFDKERAQIINVNEIDNSESIFGVLFLGIFDGGGIGFIIFIVIVACIIFAEWAVKK